GLGFFGTLAACSRRRSSSLRISSSRLISSVSMVPASSGLGGMATFSRRTLLSDPVPAGCSPRGTSSPPTILTSLSLSCAARRTPLSGGWGERGPGRFAGDEGAGPLPPDFGGATALSIARENQAA